MSSATDQIPEAEDGAVRMAVFVIGASLQVAVIRCFKDIGPKRVKKADMYVK